MYAYLGVSKQSIQQKLKRHQRSLENSHQFIEKAEALRQAHAEMGCRKMALILSSRAMEEIKQKLC